MIAENGNTVNAHYRGTFEDGTEFDSSRTRGESITFEIGSGQMIPGFESGVTGMSVGETKTFTLEPSDAYGDHYEERVQSVPRNQFGEGVDFAIGNAVQGINPDGQRFMATISEVKEDTVSLDFNHPLAGKTITFEVEVLEIS
jgi:peptidylprolyl isomerase